ncbi:MAG: hypothetical protein IJS50_04695 [Desulfovibrio sp.]|nr:hypothetical protein [Desulfovibrio sp.]
MKKIFFLFMFYVLFSGKTCFAAETWAIYWYLCGSDLEQRYGAATNDIIEVANANLSSPVKVVMQTGGSENWDTLSFGDKNLQIKNNKLERFVFSSEQTMEKIGEAPQASMGNPKILVNFLRFCLENYPADHKILIIWDHGGGSSKTFANDQNFGMSGMSLHELNGALAEVFGKNPQTPPFEIIGFDACLMATIDTAMHVHGYANYLVASQEVESGYGWSYQEPLDALSKNPGISPLELSKIICDSFLKANEDAKEDDYDPSYESTLSVIDLKDIPTLKATWDLLGLELLALDREDIFTQLGRKAKACEKFINSANEAFSNMLDLGSYLKSLRQTSPEVVDAALELLEQTVVYKVSGAKHRQAMGLSCYYPFDGAKTYEAMLSPLNLSSFVLMQGLQFGLLSEEKAKGYFEAIFANIEKFFPEESPTAPAQEKSQFSALIASSVQAVNKCKPLEKLDISSLEDWKINISKEGNAVLNLGKDRCKYLDNVSFFLALVDIEQNLMIVLGSDADMYSDWDNGRFTSHFQNRWAQINDNLVTLEYVSQDEKYFYYNVPVKLNGERVVIQANYDLEKSCYNIIGAHRIMDNGIPDKFLVKIKPGDSITTLFEACYLNKSEDLQELEIDTFKVKDRIHMEDTDLGDCQLAYVFSMDDIQGNNAMSEIALITVENGKISFSK